MVHPCEVKACQARTIQSVPGGGLTRPSGLVADPLLTAATRELDAPRGLAPNQWRLRVGAQRHAADGSVHAQAVVFAAGLEALAVAVDNAVVLTAGSHHVCGGWGTSSQSQQARGSRTLNDYSFKDIYREKS